MHRKGGIGEWWLVRQGVRLLWALVGVFLAELLVLGVWGACAQSYVLTDLGAYVVPTGINERGDISLETMVIRNGQWIQLFDSTAEGRTEGIDENGVAFGTALNEGTWQAFTYYQRLSFLKRQPGFISSVATGKVGGTVWGSGEVREPDGTVRRVPLRWQGSRVDRLDLGSQCGQAWVEAVSTAGVPVGACFYKIPSGRTNVWWDGEGGIHLPSEPSLYGLALTANGWGLIGGQDDPPTDATPMLWDLWGGWAVVDREGGKGVVTALGTFQVLGYRCMAGRISPCFGSTPTEAVWWFWDTAVGWFTRLRLVDLTSAPGWSLEKPTAVTSGDIIVGSNSYGRIVGVGTFNGEPHGWLMTLVEAVAGRQ